MGRILSIIALIARVITYVLTWKSGASKTTEKVKNEALKQKNKQAEIIGKRGRSRTVIKLQKRRY